MLKIEKPRVGLLSIGEEEHKGNALTRDATPLLKALAINFIGNVEGRDLFSGHADVIVCDGFVGNVALKVSEGLVGDDPQRCCANRSKPRSRAKSATLLSRSRLQGFQEARRLRRISAARRCLGVKGVCIICHGRSDSNAIKNAIRVAADFASSNMNQRIEEELREFAEAGVKFHAPILAFVALLACASAPFASKREVQSCSVEADARSSDGRAGRHRRWASSKPTVDPEWHMYSLTTPPGPIPTTIKLRKPRQSRSSPFSNRRPIRKFDPNFNADTETYEGTQTFLARIQLKKDLPAGPVTITFEPRYQTCSGTPAFRRARAGHRCAEHRGRRSGAAVTIPAGYIEAKPGRSVRRSARLVPQPTQTESGRLPRSRLRLRPRRHLHALRLPDDPDHDVVLRRTARRLHAGDHVLPRHHFSLQRRSA